MKSSKELTEERAHLLEELETLSRLDTLKREEKAKWDNNTRAIDEIDEELTRVKKFEEQQKVAALANGTRLNSGSEETREIKTEISWRSAKGEEIAVFKPSEKLSSERDQPQYHIGEIARMLMYGPQNADERRALGEGIDANGGFAVPETLAKAFVDAFRAKSRVTQAGARTVGLTSDNLNMVKIISEPVPQWRAEHGEVTEGQPVFDRIRWEPKSLALAVPVSWEVLEDAVNLEEMLRRSLVEGMASEIDRVALFGSGTDNEPRGVTNTAGVSFVTTGANGTAISNYSLILEAYGQLLNDNVEAESIAAIMSPREYVAFAGLTATDNQPLLLPGLLQNVRFLQTSKVPVDETRGTAANASTIVMGDFSDLVYGLRQGIRLEFIKNARWKNMEAVFLIHARVDVAVLHPESFVLIPGIIPA